MNSKLPPPAPSDPAATRAERLAVALRANLKRRKDQARQRGSTEDKPKNPKEG